MRRSPSSPLGLHRVLGTAGERSTLPQSAARLDPSPEIWPDEVRLDVQTLNLDAASYRQLADKHQRVGGEVDGNALRAEVLQIIATRGKMQNPVTGSGGMLIGTVAEVGPDSPLGLRVGDRVATLVSLSLTPLHIGDGLVRWDGRSEQVPATGHAILFGRSIAAHLPEDLDSTLALRVLDVCGAPALVRRVVRQYAETAQDSAPYGEADASHRRTKVCVLGAAGKSGSLSLAAARDAGADHLIGVVRDHEEGARLRAADLADEVVVVDARDPLGLADAVCRAGGPVDVTVVCVDVPGCEQPAILSTAEGGTVVFFSMATSFAAAALGAEGVAADVTLLIGNGYVPGHAAYALDLVRRLPAVPALWESRPG